MTDYIKLKNICRQNSRLSEEIIDDRLIYYAAQRDRLEREMDQRLYRYKHITGKFRKSWVNMLKSQYLAHRIFKENGLIRKYLNHSEIKSWDKSWRNFLQQQARCPWRFTFSQIEANPEKDFYEMTDVFTGDPFLLYSPGITSTMADQPGVALWFNLIGFNGSCWQSFGPIGAYRSFNPDDIFFFATELNPGIESEEDLLAHLEGNPVPYMMLIAGSNYPMTYNGKDRLVQHYGWHPVEEFESSKFKKGFKIEYTPGIYRLTQKKWGGPPHFAMAHYDEKEKILFTSSMTGRGYAALIRHLGSTGYNLSTAPDIRVSPSMLFTAREILRKDIQPDPYLHKLPQTVPAGESELLDKMNQLIALALPAINENKEPDLEALAQQVGLEWETAREIMGKVMDRMNELRKNQDITD